MLELNKFFSILLLITTLTVLIIALFVWQRRKTQGGYTFFYLCICIAIYTFGYSMELNSVTLSEIDFWGKVQYAGLCWLPSLFFLLAHDITTGKRKLYTKIKIILILIPSLTFLFRLTNDYHHLIYTDMKLVNNGYFLVLSFESGVWFNVHYIYVTICCIISSVMYYRGLRRSRGYKYRQLLILFIASLNPMLSLISNHLGIVPFQLDIGPFVAFVASIVFTYAILRYDMMHIIPLSREKIFDWIYDGVIVTDINLNLKDYNRIAKKFFKGLNPNFIGRNIGLCTEECPVFVEQLNLWYEKNKSKSKKNAEASVDDIFEFIVMASETERIYYLARPMGLYDGGYMVGITILITDISKEKEMLFALEKNAQYDDLTGLFNRRYFIELVTNEFKQLNQQSTNGVMVMFDIDHFKQVNDIYGHQAGDYILKELACLAKSNLRHKDLLGRYGGEEFIAFLPEISLEQALITIETIRTTIEKHAFIYDGKHIKVTTSFGMVSYYNEAEQSYGTFDEVVKKADEALYQAKNSGRNQVVVYSKESTVL